MKGNETIRTGLNRRDFVATAAISTAAMLLPHHAAAVISMATPNDRHKSTEESMKTTTVNDGTRIFYKDWGPKDAQPVVFHHGWPLSSDDWDVQMLFFLGNGYRVVAHDRRGRGRSSQVDTGHDMDHYASDASAVAEQLDLRNAIHIGHSTGGGEVARYIAKYGEPQGRVAKVVLIAAVPPLWSRPRRTRAALRLKCSGASVKRWPTTGRSFF
jgi:non-heme chloroperoxidase